MSLHLENQSLNLFYSQSVPPKHLRTLSLDSTHSTNSGLGSDIAFSPRNSRKQSFQGEEITNIASAQLSKISTPRENISTLSNTLLDKQINQQTSSQEEINPMKIAMLAMEKVAILEKKLKEQEIIQEQQRQIEREEQEKRLIILEQENLFLKRQSTHMEQDLLQELERTKKELQIYKMGQEVINRDLKKKSTYIEQDLLLELEIVSRELERTKKELYTYKNKI